VLRIRNLRDGAEIHGKTARRAKRENKVVDYTGL
jgi:hypothetical protein